MFRLWITRTSITYSGVMLQKSSCNPFVLIFHNVHTKYPPPPTLMPLHCNTSHFPPPFLCSSPPLFSLFLPSYFCYYLVKAWLFHTVSKQHLHSAFASKGKKTPTPGPTRRGVGLNSLSAGGSPASMKVHFYIAQPVCLMFSKYRS